VPFTAGALYFNPPVAFMSLIPAYVVGMYIVCCLLEFVTFKFLAFGILMLLTG